MEDNYDVSICRSIDEEKSQKSHIITENYTDLDFDPLIDFLNDSELKTIFRNHEKVKYIIVIQCLFYFNIFRNLFFFKNKARNEIYDESNNKFESPTRNISPVNKRVIQPLMKFTSQGKISLSRDLTSSLTLDEMNLPLINQIKKTQTKFSSEKQLEKFKLGIIGCGRIGTELARHLIGLRDSSANSGFQLIISTRRPDKVNADILSSIDDGIEVILDNERVFMEAHIIFLCLLPHCLDLVLKEVSQSFRERIEKIKKKKSILFPTVVSVLSAMSVEKLSSLLPEEVNVQRTYVLPFMIKEKKIFRSSPIGQLNSKKSCRFKINTLHYVNDSAINLFNEQNHINNSIVEYILKGFHSAFYTTKKKKEFGDTTTNKFLSEDNFSYELLRCIFVEEEYESVVNYFEGRKLKEEFKKIILDQCQKNFILILTNLIKVLYY